MLLAGRLAIGTLFFYSGFSKLTRPIEYFQIAIAPYDIVPEIFVAAISWIVPSIELLLGTFLLAGYWLNGSAAILAALTGLFQLVLAQALIRRLPIDECGCFGGGLIHLTLYQSFVLDTIAVLVLIKIATSSSKKFSLDNLWLASSPAKG